MSSRASESLAVERVIGEVVDSFTACVKMNVIYNGSKHVSNGHELMPALLAARPRVEIGGEDMRSAYTLVSPFILHGLNSFDWTPSLRKKMFPMKFLWLHEYAI